MQQSAIFGPFIGMMLLSFAVWTYMYVRRLHFIFVNRVDPQKFATRAEAMAAGPPALQNPSNNLMNLFELPVLFYALCLYLHVTGTVTQLDIVAAWVFLVFRVAHSTIHCTVNIVMARFTTYAVAALALWFLLARAVWGVL